MPLSIRTSQARWPGEGIRRRIPVWLAMIALVMGCIDSPSSLEPLPAGGIHVLFVGNSLTYVNDLPGTLATIGNIAGDTIRVAQAAGPDLALIDHWNGASNAAEQIKLGNWNYVILQQGPTSTIGVDRDTLILATRLFDPLIRAAGGKTSLYMVWPSSDRFAFFDNVRASYQLAADTVHGVFMPAGVAWLEAWKAIPSLQFYGSDGFHPSPAGTLLAALVIYERVTGHDARNLPDMSIGSGSSKVDEATVRILETAAHSANVKYP
jgi:hypothetical protein